MIIDCITYNGEADLFDLRYNILKNYVDEFVVVEFAKTFSGKPKEPLFNYQATTKPISYHFVAEEQYSKYAELAQTSPNTVGAEHWKREFMQKEYIKDCLTHLKDDDLAFIGDCDEIWDTELLKWSAIQKMGLKLKLKVYTYYLNNRSSEKFWGTIVAPYSNIKNECLNHLRTLGNLPNTSFYAGWHFTSLKDNLKSKLTDSYTEESYAREDILDNLEGNITNSKDFLGRNFTYSIDELDWPRWLKDNRDKYLHLLK